MAEVKANEPHFFANVVKDASFADDPLYRGHRLAMLTLGLSRLNRKNRMIHRAVLNFREQCKESVGRIRIRNCVELFTL
jgi:hypothetical protein